MITALITFAFQTVTAELPLPPLHWGSNELTCPVGGERFSAAAAFTYSIMGRRPDGKPCSENSLSYANADLPRRRTSVPSQWL